MGNNNSVKANINEQKNIIKAPVNTQEERVKKEDAKINIFLVVVFGLVVGFISGLFGGGGGMIAVPVLTSVLKKPQKVAHATALLVILPVTIVSGILYSVLGNFDAKVVLPTTVGVVIGGILGAICLKRFSNNAIRIIFSIVMLFFGVKLIFN